MTTTYDTILVAREGHIATITLNRPDKLNALSDGLLRELYQAARRARPPSDVLVRDRDGRGRLAFAAGADIGGDGESMTSAERAGSRTSARALGERIETTRLPASSAAVNGFAPRRMPSPSASA